MLLWRGLGHKLEHGSSEMGSRDSGTKNTEIIRTRDRFVNSKYTQSAQGHSGLYVSTEV
jgi:hypothetical protein